MHTSFCIHKSLPASASPQRGPARDVPARTTESVLAVFHAYGGLAPACDVAELLRVRWHQPISRLARWIVNRRVLSVESAGGLYLPLFQFDLAAASVRTDARLVFDTLLPVLDSHEMARWFVEANSWLGDEAPAHVFMLDPQRVMQAARADRFVAMG